MVKRLLMIVLFAISTHASGDMYVKHRCGAVVSIMGVYKNKYIHAVNPMNDSQPIYKYNYKLGTLKLLRDILLNAKNNGVKFYLVNVDKQCIGI